MKSWLDSCNKVYADWRKQLGLYVFKLSIFKLDSNFCKKAWKHPSKYLWGKEIKKSKILSRLAYNFFLFKGAAWSNGSVRILHCIQARIAQLVAYHLPPPYLLGSQGDNVNNNFLMAPSVQWNKRIITTKECLSSS